MEGKPLLAVAISQHEKAREELAKEAELLLRTIRDLMGLFHVSQERRNLTEHSIVIVLLEIADLTVDRSRCDWKLRLALEERPDDAKSVTRIAARRLKKRSQGRSRVSSKDLLGYVEASLDQRIELV